MNNRRALREHFERTTGPVPPGLEADVRRRLTTAPQESRPHWTLGAAAAMLALLAIGVLLYAGANSRRAVPAAPPSPRASASPGWNTRVAPELVPPATAPVCTTAGTSAPIDYVVLPMNPPHASVTNMAIDHSATGDAVVIGIEGGYPSRIQVRLVADGTEYTVALFGTTAAGRQGLVVSGPIHGIQVEDPNAGWTHTAAVFRVSVTGLSCIKVVPGSRSITLEFSSGS